MSETAAMYNSLGIFIYFSKKSLNGADIKTLDIPIHSSLCLCTIY